MKLKLPWTPEALPAGGYFRPVVVRKITDRQEILSHIDPRRVYAATAFAHLETSFPESSKWYSAVDADRSAFCLIARGVNPGYILTMGDPDLVNHILQSVDLPGRTGITCQPEHLSAIEESFELEWHLQAQRMVVTQAGFKPATEEATRLKPAHVGDLNRLYEFEHSGHFSASHIRRGVFYGIWHDEQLVAVAGTHVITPDYGIAYVGNVLTHPAFRNRGLARICASSVTAELLKQCGEVVLNVESHNQPAVRAYTSLGYADSCRIVEAIGHRKSLIGAIITSVCRKLGLVPKYREGMEPNGQLPSQGHLPGRLGTQGNRGRRT